MFFAQFPDGKPANGGRADFLPLFRRFLGADLSGDESAEVVVGGFQCDSGDWLSLGVEANQGLLMFCIDGDLWVDDVFESELRHQGIGIRDVCPEQNTVDAKGTTQLQ